MMRYNRDYAQTDLKLADLLKSTEHDTSLSCDH